MTYMQHWAGIPMTHASSLLSYIYSALPDKNNNTTEYKSEHKFDFIENLIVYTTLTYLLLLSAVNLQQQQSQT